MALYNEADIQRAVNALQYANADHTGEAERTPEFLAFSRGYHAALKAVAVFFGAQLKWEHEPENMRIVDVCAWIEGE